MKEFKSVKQEVNNKKSNIYMKQVLQNFITKHIQQEKADTAHYDNED